MAIGIGTVELPEVNMRGVIVDGPPAGWGNAFESAVDEYGLGVRVIEAMIVGQARKHWGNVDRHRGLARRQRAVDGNKGTVDENIAVVRFGVADPHEGPYRPDLAAAEERGANAEDGVAVAGDRAVGEIDGAAQIESIARAFDIHMADYVLCAGDEQSFRLAEVVIV